MKQLTEEMSQKYGFTLAEMERIKDITTECWDHWDDGTWNKSQIVDHIASETVGNINMGILTGMATGAMMETKKQSSRAILAALKKVRYELASEV